MKQLITDSNYKDIKMPFLFLVFAVGEELSINEERFLNKALRRADAGRDFHHLPISPVCFCVAGGDCEHGSILYRLFRAVTNWSLNCVSEKRYGMTAFDFVEVAVIDSSGRVLGPNQVGRLVANSPCTMECYKNDTVATEEFFVKDINGKRWGDMSVYGYIDKKGRVYMRNRILDKESTIAPFEIADEIMRDKKFMSCEIVMVEDKYVAHVEFLPEFRGDKEKKMQSAKKRCSKRFEEVSDRLLFRIHKGSYSFELTKSGKRDVKALINEGIRKAIII